MEVLNLMELLSMINSKKENEPSQKYVRIFHYVILYILILSTAVFIGGRFSII